MNTTKKKQTHIYKEQISGYQWSEVRGERQEIRYMNILCSTKKCHHYFIIKWNINYKNVESLHYTPETNIVLQIEYTSIREREGGEEGRQRKRGRKRENYYS